MLATPICCFFQQAPSWDPGGGGAGAPGQTATGSPAKAAGKVSLFCRLCRRKSSRFPEKKPAART
jgi:hypothetical protein